MPNQKLIKASTLPKRSYSSKRPERYAIPWTPDLLRAAKVQAEWGHLRLAGDLYVDLLGEDDRHHGTLASVAQGVLTLPLSFDADGDRRRKSKIEAAAEEDFDEMIPLCEAISLISQALSLGVGLAQLVPWQDSNGRMIPRLKTWETRHLKYLYESQTWCVETDNGDLPITPGDGQWALFTPWGVERPWSRGTWRACALWALLKHYARRDWARQGELAGGLRTAEVPDDAKDSDRRQLANDLEDIGADAVLVPPPGYKPAIIQASANTHQTFLSQIQIANSAIAVANKGESLTSGTDGQSGLGGAGLGKVQQDVSAQRIFFVAQAWQQFLYEQVLYPWAVINFGKNAPVPKPIYQTQKEEDLATKAQRWTLTAGAIAALRAQGLPIDVDKIATEGAIPLLEPGQEPTIPAPPLLPAESPSLKGEPLALEAPRLLTIRKVGDEWELWTKDGASMIARHKTREEAEAQERAIEAQKHLSLEAPLHSGVMIALYPPPDVAKQLALAIEGAEPPEELHITLGYYGRLADLTPEQVNSLKLLASELCLRDHLTGQIAGSGAFTGDEARVLWAAVDVPGLDLLRADLVRQGHWLGVPPQAEHGYTPHMTLAYIDPASALELAELPNTPLHFPALSLILAGERIDLPFTAP